MPKGSRQKHEAPFFVSLLLLSGELHTSTASQLPQVLLPLWDEMWLLLQCWSPSDCKVRMIFPFSCLCRFSWLLLGTVICPSFAFSFFSLFRKELHRCMPLPSVVSLLYSNIFPILKRSQMFVNCPWVRTRTYRLKNLKVVCRNGSHVSWSLFFVPVFTVGHNFPHVVSLDPTRRVKGNKIHPVLLQRPLQQHSQVFFILVLLYIKILKACRWVPLLTFYITLCNFTMGVVFFAS